MTLDDLLALNREIVALSRAGLPLGEGLLHASARLPRRLQAVAARLGSQVNSGSSLDAALAREVSSIPNSYLAVVRAGQASGHISEALESFTTATDRRRKLFRSVGIAFVYPACMAVISAVAMIVSLPRLFASLRIGLRIEPQLADPRVDRILANLEGLSPWLAAAIFAGLAFLAVWYYARRRAAHPRPFQSDGWMPWFPGPHRILYWGELATLLRTLANLVRRDVPLLEALLLSTDVTGSAELQRAGAQLAERVKQGASLGPTAAGRRTMLGDKSSRQAPSRYPLPPLVVSVIRQPPSAPRLAMTLAAMADHYDLRADHALRLAQVTLPAFLTLLIGGTLVLFLSGSLFGPFYWLLMRIGFVIATVG